MSGRKPLPGAGAYMVVPEPFRDEETQTSCPVCKGSKHDRCTTCRGSGAVDLEVVGPSQYRRVVCRECDGKGIFGSCLFCRGVGMVSASRASGFRRALLA